MNIERLVPVTIGSAPPSSRRHQSLSAGFPPGACVKTQKRPTFAGVGRFFHVRMLLRVATWNINSVRLRLDLVTRFLTRNEPDILCLQEIKCREELFPREAFHALGYAHIAISGQAGYHGVATLSKLPFASLPRESFCGTSDARHLGCAIALPTGDSLALHNIYVPAGGDIPDPSLNIKFKQKLAYLAALGEWYGRGHDEHSLLVGDFNVAPLETDVWSHKQLLKVVSHTPVEVEALAKVQKFGAWVDIVRRFISPDEKLFTWWSYRARDWEASDRGRRLDHIWGSASMASEARAATVLKETRGWSRPSDHVPVIVDFNV
jgi:exodeoxyribonuclease III